MSVTICACSSAASTSSSSSSASERSSPSSSDRRLPAIRSPSEPSTTSNLLRSPASVAFLSVLATIVGGATYWRYFKRIRNAEYLTPATLRYRKWLVGKCVSVGDADGFRLYHQPGPPFLRDVLYPLPKPRSPPSSSSSRRASVTSSQQPPHVATKETLSVRLAGADAPESGHFGKEPQPFAKEAKDELKRLVLGKTVWCQVAHVDQYKRLVATPYVLAPPYIFGRTNVSLRLVQQGLATVYTQAGAAYANPTWWDRLIGRGGSGAVGVKNAWGRRRLEKAEEKAKLAKKGMWSLGKKLEKPDEYKRRTKAAE